MHIAALEKKIEVLEFLIKQDKVDAGIASNEKNTVLHYFVRQSFTADEQLLANNLIKNMVKRGAGLDSQNEVGETPIFLAVLKGTSSNNI